MRGLFSQFLESLVQKLSEIGVIEEAADRGYNTAMEMCGNEGQVSIIDMTGYDAFLRAAETAVDGSGSVEGMLISACPYPNAVSVILMESAQVIIEHIEEAMGSFFDSGDDEGEEFEEGESDW